MPLNNNTHLTCDSMLSHPVHTSIHASHSIDTWFHALLPSWHVHTHSATLLTCPYTLSHPVETSIHASPPIWHVIPTHLTCPCTLSTPLTHPYSMCSPTYLIHHCTFPYSFHTPMQPPTHLTHQYTLPKPLVISASFTACHRCDTQGSGWYTSFLSQFPLEMVVMWLAAFTNPWPGWTKSIEAILKELQGIPYCSLQNKP